jgi:outer membrane protein
MNAKKLRRLMLACAMTGAVMVPIAAQAQSTNWAVRLRIVQLNSANKDSTGLNLSINDKIIPDIDFSYFITPEWSTELLLTVPQKHTIRSNGTDIGSLRHLPPTLTLQYRLTGLGAFSPYVGAGLNYTRFSSVSFDPAVQQALQPSLKKSSFGPAVQIGFDYGLSNNLLLSFDIKKVQIRTDVSSAGTKVGTFKVDPMLIGAGVGWKF